MRQMMSTAMAGLVVAAGLLSAQPARAGEKEWAVAGKVLTGIVAFNVLNDVVNGDRDHRPSQCREPRYDNTRVVVREYDHAAYRPVIHHRRQEPVRVETRVVTVRSDDQCDPYPRYYDRSDAGRGSRYARSHRRTVVRRDPIIRHLSRGRRIYQPPVRGHKAFIQVYSTVERRWVNVRECESIW